MSKSIYEYVRNYEESNNNLLLKDCFIVVRVDGQGFHQFSKRHDFKKPNDKRCLDLMNESAKHVMKKYYPNIVIAYGESDEFSFIIRRLSKLFNRRQNKITSLIVSSFTSAFVYYWSKYFTNHSTDGTIDSVKLQYPPAFDGRCILYPNEKLVKDYLKWRQVDCHVNNLYNTTFYALTGQYTKYQIISDKIQIVSQNNERPKPLSAREATDRLSKTLSSDKHEILFKEFGINYNNELEQFKKGSVLVLDTNEEFDRNTSRKDVNKKRYQKHINLDQSDVEELDLDQYISVLNVDIIGDKFWTENDKLLL